MKKERSVPVVFFHEGNQDYLKYAVLAAQRCNEKVVLLGDKTNENFANQWYDTTQFDQSSYLEFEKRYVHMSSNTLKFEITAFKKYYMVKQFMELSGEQECMLLDSDILSYCNYSELEFINEYKASVSTNENQDRFNWTSSGHSSYWTVDYLNDFLQFCEDTYEFNIQLLQQKYNYHVENHIKGGICDMTLLYLWALERQGIYNCAQCVDATFDHNINTAENYFKNEYKMDVLLQIKKIKFVDGLPYFINQQGERVRTYTLHCQGSAKEMMKDYYLQDFKFLIIHRYELLFKKFMQRYVFAKFKK